MRRSKWVGCLILMETLFKEDYARPDRMELEFFWVLDLVLAKVSIYADVGAVGWKFVANIAASLRKAQHVCLDDLRIALGQGSMRGPGTI